ncbi:MAG: ABC transporter ATP-binding protein [Flavobacteriales bacterium]|nr:ABC transporter ATP-binding protein [Flavobacteriales bacterium]
MKSLQYLNKYFVKYKWHFLLGILFTIISNYFGVRMPLYVKSTVDNLMGTTSINSVNDALLLSLQIGGIYILLSIGKGFFLFLMRQTIIVMSRLIEFDLKNEIYVHYQKLDLAFFKRNSTGDLMNRISEDVSQVRMYLGPGIMYTINLIVLFAMIVTQMVKISPVLTFFVLLPLPIMSFLIYWVSSKMNLLSTQVQQEQSRLSTIAQETFAGIRVIKAYNRDQEIYDKFETSANEYKSRSMKLVLVNALFMPTIIFLIGISTLVAIYLGGLMTYPGAITLSLIDTFPNVSKDFKLPSGEITPGDIVAFIFFVNNLTWPFASIGWVTSINQRAAASQKRINEFLQTEPEITNPTTGELSFDGRIEFKNVTFTYPNTGIMAIENLSFKINKGDTLAIVGKTGSGKSTILNLVMRQYDCDSGEILVNGINIKKINLDAFREQSGVVPQDVFLFSDSIANNLKFGLKNDKVDTEVLIEATKKTHVYHNIKEFPDQFETLLGERGVNLSGGQKQRVSIARALIRDPKFLLLDDCLSAVDTETEEIILRNLNEDAKNRTTIIVSHRISTIRNANHILVLENGRIVESGTHQTLMELNKEYAEMYHKQLTEN